MCRLSWQFVSKCVLTANKSLVLGLEKTFFWAILAEFWQFARKKDCFAKDLCYYIGRSSRFESKLTKERSRLQKQG